MNEKYFLSIRVIFPAYIDLNVHFKTKKIFFCNLNLKFKILERPYESYKELKSIQVTLNKT